MGKTSNRRRWLMFVVLPLALLLTGFLSWVSFFTPAVQPWWYSMTREGRRLLGWDKDQIPLEEKRAKEEVILKKMDEASAQDDWRTLAPEYPRPRKPDTLEGEERLKALKDSPEFKALDKEVKDYLKKKKDLVRLEPPNPPVREGTDFTRLKDKGEEQIMERLLAAKEKTPPEKPLEENLHLGIRGPLVSRRLVERPPLPQVKVRVEAEIELTLWVLPNGIVDRAIPSVKGDAELERIAIQYLKQWRFVPLPRDQAQVEQWGTIPVKFRLQ